MKETIITVRRKKTELITLLICFLLANLANLYAIISYNGTSFTELFTSIGYVLVATIVLYVIWSGLRIIYYGIRSLFKSKKNS